MCCSHCLLCREVVHSPPSQTRSNAVTYVQVDSIVLWAVVLPGGSCDSSRNAMIVRKGMFVRFKWRLTSGERTGRHTLQKRGIYCVPAFCVRACWSLGGVRRSGNQIALGLRSLTLLRCLSRHSSLALGSCLTLQVMAPKAYLTVKSQAKVAAKKIRKKLEVLLAKVLDLHRWSFTRSCFWGGHLHKTRLRLILWLDFRCRG